jgi:carnitine-CoA ligase
MEPIPVGDLLRQRAHEHPDRLYLWSGDQRLTYGEVDERSDRVANGLLSLGVTPGDRVAFICSNRIEMLELYFACAKLGAVQVPMNVFLKGEFLRYQLDDCQASTLVCDAAGHAAALPLIAGLPDLRSVIALDDAAGDDIPYEQLRGADPSRPDVSLSAASLMSILYTSGTTGMPKGCMLSHGWYLRSASVSTEMLGYTEKDRLYTALPLFHAWAQGMVFGGLLHGLSVTIDPIFSAQRMLERLAETQSTTLSGVGMMGLAMLALPASDADRAHNLRVVLMMPLTPDQQEQFESRFGARILAQLYGQTECGALCYSPIDEPGKRGTLGRPSPLYDLRIVDDDDTEVPTGDVGEIVVRPKVNHALFQGYWRKPEATAEIWRNLWHHTGDFGRADADGYVTFVDRKKDALRRRGENVSSVQLESAIVGHPKIAEAAVHAIPSRMGEDDIKACLVVAPGEKLTPDELFSYFKDRLPYFAIPRYVELVDELPRNATMRVMKHVLRARGVTAETWDFDALGLNVAPAERRSRV